MVVSYTILLLIRSFVHAHKCRTACSVRRLHITSVTLVLANSDYLLWERAAERRLTPAKHGAVFVADAAMHSAHCTSIDGRYDLHKRKYCTQFVDKFNFYFIPPNEWARARLDENIGQLENAFRSFGAPSIDRSDQRTHFNAWRAFPFKMSKSNWSISRVPDLVHAYLTRQ